MKPEKLLDDLDVLSGKYADKAGDDGLVRTLHDASAFVRLHKLHGEIVDGVNKALATYSETDEIYRQICDELHKVIGWDRVSIAIFEEASGIVTAFVLTKGVKTKIFPEKRSYSYKGSILEKIITTGEPVIIGDTRDGVLATDKIHLREGTRSRFAYPLKLYGKIVGSINFSSKEANRFNQSQCDMLSRVAPILAFMVDTALQNEIIGNINDVLASSFEPEDLYHRVCDELYKLINWDRVSIAVFEEASGIVTAFVLTKGVRTKSFPEKRHYPYKGSILEMIMETEKPVIVEDTCNNLLDTDKTHCKEGIRSRLAYPLKFRGTVIGSINFSSRNVNNFDKAQFDILGHIAPILAFMVENTRLFMESSRVKREYRDLTKTIDAPWG